MVEVAPKSREIRINFWHYFIFLLLMLLLLIVLLWVLLDSQWGASNPMAEWARKYLSQINRFRPGAKPEDNLANALRMHGVERIEGKRYSMFFSVTDSNSDPLSVLKNNVTIAVGEPGTTPKPVSIERINSLSGMKEWNDRMTFAAVMDYSGSMFPEDLDAIESNCSDFLSNLSFPYSGTVIKFNTQVQELIGVSANPSDIESALKRRVSLGNTALYEGMYKGVENIKGRPHLRCLLLTTDGNNNVYTRTLEEVISASRQNFISSFVFGFGWLKVEVLKKIADETDGYYVYVPDSSQLKTWFPKIAKIVNNIQVAEFFSPIDIQPGSSIELTVSVGSNVLKRSR